VGKKSIMESRRIRGDVTAASQTKRDGGKAGEEEEGEVSGANRKTREQMERTARTQYGKSERMG